MGTVHPLMGPPALHVVLWAEPSWDHSVQIPPRVRMQLGEMHMQPRPFQQCGSHGSRLSLCFIQLLSHRLTPSFLPTWESDGCLYIRRASGSSGQALSGSHKALTTWFKVKGKPPIALLLRGGVASTPTTPSPPPTSIESLGFSHVAWSRTMTIVIQEGSPFFGL